MSETGWETKLSHSNPLYHHLLYQFMSSRTVTSLYHNWEALEQILGYLKGAT